MPAPAPPPAPASPPSPASPLAFGPRLARVSVLVVDDEPGMRNFMARILGPQCRRIELASSAAEATDWLAAARFDVIVLDNILGDARGLDWLAAQRARAILPPVILISAFADLEIAIEALQAGAADLILKPFRSNQLLNAVARSAEQTRLQTENSLLRHELRRRAEGGPALDDLIGSSPAIEEIRAAIARVAPLSSSVLLTGPSGAGKEVAARMIHARSGRAEGHFVAVNCAGLSQDLAEAELFGHVGGAREGLFLSAQGGTLFLDQIAELPLGTQAKLLRALEDRRIRPVGAERELPVDLRLICAANADLEALVAAGRFRADLYYRINIVRLAMPPLDARGEDVLELAALFMARLSAQLALPPVEITPALRAALVARSWPGNVRELRNLIERTLILGRFPPEFSAPVEARPVGSSPDETPRG